jgi:hypothetical protein
VNGGRFTKPHGDFSGIGIDLAHLRDLIILLVSRSLIDADSVNPDVLS